MPVPPGTTPDSDQPTHPDQPAALFERVYLQLRGMAQHQINHERAGHTLSATALVHEAYLRLAGPNAVEWRAEAAFCAAAAQAMRRILVDHARARAAASRGGRWARRAALNLAELPDPASPDECAGFLILDDAVARLESADPQAATVVRLRYYGGLSIEETAHAMDISEPTVKRAWAFARAWLRESIEREP